MADGMYDISSYTIADRDYLETQSSWLSGPARFRAVSPITTLQSSVYTETAPLMGMAGGERVMVFLSDDGTKGSLNRTTLVYSVYNKDTDSWSAPLPIQEDGTGDFYPHLASDGETMVVA